MSLKQKETLAILGAGPKGLAVAVKAKVLQEFGIATPQIILIEKNIVGANWTGEFGYTDGDLKLGTSPEKDLVFPIEVDLQNKALSQRIQRRLLHFSWTSFLVQTNRFSDWIDGGRTAPPHKLWASYLQWVAKQLTPQVSIIHAEVKRIDLTTDNNYWELTLKLKNLNYTLNANRLMLTGPGHTSIDFPHNDTNTNSLYNLETFWHALKKKTLPPFGSVAIVGAGEQTASALHALTRYSKQFQIDVIAPKGFIASRAESHYENQFYSQPDKCGWQTLSIKDRRDFINRTDLGVFSQQALSILKDEAYHAIIPGRVVHTEATEERITLTISYQQKIQVRNYDHVLLATGFDPAAMLLSLLSQRAKTKLIEFLGKPVTRQSLATNIGFDLSVQDFYPRLHLPMLAALMQGPGFANLSCLGRLSDRLMAPFLQKQTHISNQLIIPLKEAQ